MARFLTSANQLVRTALRGAPSLGLVAVPALLFCTGCGLSAYEERLKEGAAASRADADFALMNAARAKAGLPPIDRNAPLPPAGDPNAPADAANAAPAADGQPPAAAPPADGAPADPAAAVPPAAAPAAAS